jgi:uncharacterized protein (DUF488 family)
MSKKLTTYTIGHSTHPLDEFIAMLRAHGIQRVIDIRTIPKSRHNPQFNGEELARRLHSARIGYVHLKKLGGLRHARRDSMNTGWRNASFRGFADYMQTPEFEEGLERAIALAEEKPSALMCAEAVPWRCHRSLVGDALLARKIQVMDILSATSAKPHQLTPFARIKDTHVTYPAETASLFSDEHLGK